MMSKAEEAGHAEIRRKLLARAQGRTLEIGAGSGFNVPHYTSDVTELVLSEPSPHMRKRLQSQLESDPPSVGSWDLSGSRAEELPFPDEHFDTVVGSYIHCTIPRPAVALVEIHRVLKPGGIYIFMEHVRDADGSVVGVVQDIMAPLQSYLGAGCHINRRTEQVLRDSPLIIDHLEHGAMPMAVPTIRPIITGVAHR